MSGYRMVTNWLSRRQEERPRSYRLIRSSRGQADEIAAAVYKAVGVLHRASDYQGVTMRFLAAFLFLCVGLVAAASTKYDSKNADKEFLERQKHVFQLLYHVHQQNIHPEQVSFGKAYNIEDHLDKYEETQWVKQFLVKYKGHYTLPQGEIFSILYPPHMHEAKAFFHVLHSAKDWETFYKTACWAREHLNTQMFVYVLSAVVLHRADCQGFILPPPYEITPHYFVRTDVINKAYLISMQGHTEDVHDTHVVDDKTVVINTNYTNWSHNFYEQSSLSYFTEDVGLNSFYYYHHLDYPFWMDGEKFHLNNDRRGEMYYFVHHQLLARYYLERLSNGMGEIPAFSWDWLIKTPYYANLMYQNGYEFPSRPNTINLKQNGDETLSYLTQVKDYERRIRDAIDHGYLVKEDGSHVNLRLPESIEELAYVIENNNNSVNSHFYHNAPTIAKILLGNSVRSANWQTVVPSALENFQTFLRDPMAYQLLKHNYMQFFVQFKKYLPAYSKEELSCPGVKIENVEVEKLVTYFDLFDIDITNAIYQDKEEAAKMEDELHIKSRQYRLDHTPFTVTTNVVSEKAMPVVVRTFLGPKYDGEGNALPLDKNRHNFVELDEFIYELKSGKNTIQRNSRDFLWTVKDFTPSHQVYKDVTEAISGSKKFELNMAEAHNGFPDRLLLPKGRKGGMPFLVYVIITPHHAPAVAHGTGYDSTISSGVGSGARLLDNLPFGFPFDRPLDEQTFFTHNMHFEDVFIFHKKESDINQAV